MMKQNKTKLQFILGGILMLTFSIAACNSSEDKVTTKDSVVTIVTPPAVRDSGDTMEVIPGKKAPGTDAKPQ